MGNFPSLVEGKQMIPLRFIRLQGGVSPLTDWAKGDALAHPTPTISAEPPQSQLNLKDPHGSDICET